MLLQIVTSLVFLSQHHLAGCELVTNDEIKQISSQLEENDVNAIQLNLSFCNNPKRQLRKLFVQCPMEEFNQRPTYKSFIKLLDNYKMNVTENEDNTAEEQQEQKEFVEEIAKTRVCQIVENFLNEKGLLESDNRSIKNSLNRIFFCIYQRYKNRNSSSGFEHIVNGEIKKGKISGGHNWVSYCIQEQIGKVRFISAKRCLAGNQVLSSLSFRIGKFSKPLSSMYLGTSPERELCTNVLCLVARENKTCRIRVGGKNIAITTFSMGCNGVTSLGSAYPNVY